MGDFVKNKLFIAWCTVLTIILLVHFSITTLFNSPVNPITYKYHHIIESYMTPLFVQNWKLFAPNPISSNTNLLVKGLYTEGDGEEKETKWLNVNELLVKKLQSNRLTPLRLSVAQISSSMIETMNEVSKDQAEKIELTEQTTSEKEHFPNKLEEESDEAPSYVELVEEAIEGEGIYPRELIILRGASSEALYSKYNRHFDEIIIKINVERFPDYFDYITEEDTETENMYITLPKMPYVSVSDL